MRHDKPLIGVSISIDPGKRLRAGHEYLYIKRSYSACIAAAGGYPLLVPPDMPPAAVAEVCDGLVISGGDDLPGSFEGGAMLIDPMRTTIHKLAPKARLVRLSVPPVLGAVILGMEADGFQSTPEIRKTMTETISVLRNTSVRQA